MEKINKNVIKRLTNRVTSDITNDVVKLMDNVKKMEC